jgi:hypothetical protein
MNRNLLVLLGVGALAYYVWYMNKKKNDGVKVEDINNDVVEEVIQQPAMIEKSKYTNAFRKQFNIKVPPIQASKDVKDMALKMQDLRYNKQMNKQRKKTPLYI